jgi:cysteine-rich repeat protein
MLTSKTKKQPPRSALLWALTIAIAVTAWGCSDDTGGGTIIAIDVPDGLDEVIADLCANGVKDPTEADIDCGGVCDACGTGKSCSQPADCDSGVCSGGSCAAASCSDGVKNGDESSEDCGGDACGKCPTGEACVDANDCDSGACESNTCVSSASCSDGVKNGDESDIDCGGTCGTCDPGQTCGAAADCDSGVCTGGACVAPSCTDDVKNGSEADTDCGGSCDPCGGGATCTRGVDCASGVCQPNGTCSGASCTDGFQNGNESDIDCGGSCGPCNPGSQCVDGDDCISNVCSSNNTCLEASCTDGVKNATETGIDCGGGNCPVCGTGSTCTSGSDCQSTVCDPATNLCVGAGCIDGVRNGTESDIDCGGDDCSPCGDDAVCIDASDCASNVCTGNVCIPATCDDGVQNANETDIDCGGDTCDLCGDGSACDDEADCDSGVCTANVCAVPACDDTVQNGDETAVDCGGPTCDACDAGSPCTSGTDCSSDICLPDNTCAASACGDSVVNGADECDSGGVDTATCNQDCTLVECGDNYINTVAGESCDDGNGSGSDGCSAACAPESGWVCVGTSPSVCTECTSGTFANGATCDDCGTIANCPVTETCDTATGAGLACPTCDDGFFGDGTATCTACTAISDCDSGLDCTSAADQTCASCAPGFVGDGTAACTACASGTFDNGATCDDCGTITDCVAVETCSVTDGTGVICPDCADGTFGDGTATCTDCTPIADCASGLACASSSDQTCATCAVGFVGDGTATCTACAAGTFDNGATCDDCGTITGCAVTETCDVATGNNDICPTCNPGFIGDGTAACTACAAGTFDNGATCDDCGTITGCAVTETCDVLTGNGDLCPDCSNGFFGDGTASCTACTAIPNCTAGTTTCTNSGDQICGTCATNYSGSGTNACRLNNGQPCTANAQCFSGICDLPGSDTCEPALVCGNGTLEAGEFCDDGNVATGDGCNATCRRENGQACTANNQCASAICDLPGSDTCEPALVCGNGTLEAGEFCDDGNVATGDGCNATCRRENGQACTANNQCASAICDLPGSDTCEPALVCGNGTVEAGEFCDDGGTANGDGCTSACLRENGQACTANNQCASAICDLPGSDTCEPALVCGNGTLEAGEFCDDGNVAVGDGCNATCRRENGQACTANNQCASGACDLPGSDTCEPANTCGNGNVEGSEQCDDGGTANGDGCSSTCQSESCFRFTNTGAEDLSNNTWFDACVTAPGTRVRVRLVDTGGVVVYDQTGTKVGTWTFDQITSTADASTQYDYTQHNRIITMGNGDKLRISGRASNNSGCGGSQGNGYGIVIYPPGYSGIYYDQIKLAMFPYNHYVSGTSPRNFGNWNTGAEISWNSGAAMYSCFPFFGTGPSLTGFLGTIEVSILP